MSILEPDFICKSFSYVTVVQSIVCYLICIFSCFTVWCVYCMILCSYSKQIRFMMIKWIFIQCSTIDSFNIHTYIKRVNASNQYHRSVELIFSPSCPCIYQKISVLWVHVAQPNVVQANLKRPRQLFHPTPLWILFHTHHDDKPEIKWITK